MMELIEGVGVRLDVDIKVFGDDLHILQRQAEAIASVVRRVGEAET
jgi:Cu/Ag efflux pump CusA